MCAGPSSREKQPTFELGWGLFASSLPRHFLRPICSLWRPLQGPPLAGTTAYLGPPPSGSPPTIHHNRLSYPITYARALACGWFPPSTHSPIPGAFPGPTSFSSHGHRGLITPLPTRHLNRVSRPLPSQAPSQSLPVHIPVAYLSPLFSGHRVDNPTPCSASALLTTRRGHGNTGLRLSRTPLLRLYSPPLPLHGSSDQHVRHGSRVVCTRTPTHWKQSSSRVKGWLPGLPI